MGSGFFALLDDIAALMDDVATMSKVATKKTAGILGDDLAVNAEKATGFVSNRELPVLWAITKGSFLNKVIILPVTFLLSAFAPGVIIPILLCGGLFLGYEGIVKISEYLFPHKHKAENKGKRVSQMTEEEAVAFEKKRVKSAILIDFILSVEIIIIALSTVVEEDIKVQIMVVSVIAILATIGVYGIVALIVRMDDAGMVLTQKDNKAAKAMGRFLVRALPVVIKTLGIVGTVALVLVSGGIFTHNIEYVHHLFEGWPSLLADTVTGLVAGLVVFAIVKLIQRVRKG